ncbi:tryptophan--tRNA ligase [Aneurinibacillus aneurinilyticus]|jgi:tryptophanyl-tRNA synthetase|uniref:Tryptophan--tRNA ligase n=1 Tax=Aneurinibacillus aneurinilyticus ATCC 12856 TaxID=649747 RepID=U1Y5C9_ANEAE|nr:tryptophan--tRNA ligase [Aneurinibacillus aneurinilyticus]ERI07357.1 tryptophan--tRNA ligase [Aneurinibacillus aneurinilyticus ATCC 12856]MCI1693061.1 tryptophan--tRNA ligase [Aneurinibacillus aneurinilyticus]MED0671656.1 tryptophan--tRNA ligase [Aneurinibacillus aneurinilyticus]MED0709375.1 tryptophan--tRNA ligase [Aneurinibacillus aneurinilyticus]MED0726007.1 tryptophan--tRNA ligase [Aneurinibacillus aneurinilyticus]
MKERILTGDRITGKLHLGHYVGSLKNRVELQNQYETYLILADVQALTTHFEKPELIKQNLRNVALDYLSAGINPDQATIFVQSLIPEIAELTTYFSMFVTVNSLRHNPTIKAEAKERGFQDMYYGFLGYPVSQTADITFCKATLVPVGEDQLPHIEQTRKIVRRFNQLYKPVLLEPKPLVGDVPRLIGLDGNNKMSKSLGNAIYLDSTQEDVNEKIKKATTDPARIHKTDLGHPEICPIYAYHQAFRKEGSNEIYESCKKGQIGCMECKRKITQSINDLLEPMRERRILYQNDAKRVDEILMSGTEKVRLVAKETMQEVREAMSMNYF